MSKKRIVVLASGRGSNFSAIADAVHRKELGNAELVGLVCNKPEAPVLQLAKQRNIPAFSIPNKTFPDKTSYESKVLKTLKALRPDLICLAGYMLLVGPRILDAYSGRILNIHPSILPAFRGLHALRQALAAGVSFTGCTVHYVTAALDDGPIVAQNKVEVIKGDTEESLAERLLPVEHRTYVEALKKLTQP